MECFLEPSKHCAHPSYLGVLATVCCFPSFPACVRNQFLARTRAWQCEGELSAWQGSESFTMSKSLENLIIFWWCELLIPVTQGRGGGGGCKHCDPSLTPAQLNLVVRRPDQGTPAAPQAGRQGFCQQPWVQPHLCHVPALTPDQALNRSEPQCFSSGKCKPCLPPQTDVTTDFIITYKITVSQKYSRSQTPRLHL